MKFSLTTPPARSGCQSLSRSVVYVERYVHVRGEMTHDLTSFLHGEKKYKIVPLFKKFQGYTNQMVREGLKLFDEKLSAQGPFPMP